MNVSCPHCATDTPAAAYCEACGKALPSFHAPSTPRIIEGASLATSHAAAELQVAKLAKTARSAFAVLLILALIQLLLGGLLLLVGIIAPGEETDTTVSGAAMAIMGVLVGGLGFINLCLAVWARRNPFPAAIIGLALFVTLWAVDIALTIGENPQWNPMVFGIKATIVAVLAQACSAGAKHRALVRELAQQQPA